MMYKEDSSQFWENIYLDNDTGWDLNGVTPIFEYFSNQLTPAKTCIIGCGFGHDAIMFAHKGFEVTAVDFSESAVKNLSYKAAEENLKIQIIQSNIFSLSPKLDNVFDYVIEQTCFCAINPNRRNEYQKLVYNIIKPGGKLIGLWFPLDKTFKDGGPPWGITIKEVKSIFNQNWSIFHEEFCSLSIKPRQGREKLIIFEKI